MINNTRPLPYYKEPLNYTGSISFIGICLVVYSIVRSDTSSNLMTPSLLIALIFGVATYFMWKTKCPNCKRPFSKKEQKHWEEDLGIKREPFTYYSRMYKYPDGSTDPVVESEKTIIRDKKYDKHYYLCDKCKYGSEKEWSEINWRWLGSEPLIQYIKKKGTAEGFGANLFEDDSYESGGKRKSIPKGVKEDLWIRDFGKRYFGNCFVCNKTIETKRFEAGHIISVANEGSDHISNLKPICMKCNRSMGAMNLYEYKDKHYSKNK